MLLICIYLLQARPSSAQIPKILQRRNCVHKHTHEHTAWSCMCLSILIDASAMFLVKTADRPDDRPIQPLGSSDSLHAAVFQREDSSYCMESPLFQLPVSKEEKGHGVKEGMCMFNHC